MNTINYRRLLLFLLAPLALMLMLWAFNLNASPTSNISVTQLAADIKDGTVEEVLVGGNGSDLTVIYKDESVASSRTSGVSSLEEILATYGVDQTLLSNGSVIITYQSPSQFTGVLVPSGVAVLSAIGISPTLVSVKLTLPVPSE